MVIVLVAFIKATDLGVKKKTDVTAQFYTPHTVPETLHPCPNKHGRAPYLPYTSPHLGPEA